jgi:hypothetical protein
MVLWLSARKVWIRSPHWEVSKKPELSGRLLLSSVRSRLLNPVTTLSESSEACDAIWVPIRTSAPTMRAMPPSTVTAVAGPRCSPQARSRLATGESIAARRTATASGITTSER